MTALGQDKAGTLYGVGVGPGDPSLITLKAHRLIARAPVLCYVSSADGHSMARAIAAESIAQSVVADRVELPVALAMCRDRRDANAAYDKAAADIAAHLGGGDEVVFLCEGDPLFFGSFANVLERLAPEHRVEVVPGVSAIHASTALAGRAFGRLAESVAIVSGRHDDTHVLAALERFDNVAIMKAGTGRARLLALLERAGRSNEACYLEYVGHETERVVHDVSTLDGDKGPYFSLFLVTRDGNGRAS